MLDKSKLIQFFFISLDPLKMNSKQKLNYWYSREIFSVDVELRSTCEMKQKSASLPHKNLCNDGGTNHKSVRQRRVLPFWAHPSFRAGCLLVSGLLLSSALCQVKNNVMPPRAAPLSVLLLGFSGSQLNFLHITDNRHKCYQMNPLLKQRILWLIYGKKRIEFNTVLNKYIKEIDQPFYEGY